MDRVGHTISVFAAGAKERPCHPDFNICPRVCHGCSAVSPSFPFPMQRPSNSRSTRKPRQSEIQLFRLVQSRSLFVEGCQFRKALCRLSNFVDTNLKPPKLSGQSPSDPLLTFESGPMSSWNSSSAAILSISFPWSKLQIGRHSLGLKMPVFGLLIAREIHSESVYTIAQTKLQYTNGGTCSTRQQPCASP